MKITKEEFADRIIKKLTTDLSKMCPSSIGLNKECRFLCLDCWTQAIEQGVEV